MRPDWLRSADEELLSYFGKHPPDYVPLAANRLGMHLGYAERRVSVLCEHGLLESVTNESIYTVTEAGRRALETDEAVVIADD
jgi:DNA-binding MarR family transcriptional regulator